MILVSGCLSGNNGFYNGAVKACEPIKRLVREKKAIPICPELLGGLSIPRERSEIRRGTGMDVLSGKCRVVTEFGRDVTVNFIAGAETALALAKKYKATKVIFKSRSPACGCGEIYDGSFTEEIIKGDGVACALLKMNGIQVITDADFLKSEKC